ncbi:MAG TPA: excinuclease ABC subunit UvrA [Candidatus Magasanikbacteria bacterium]|nr:MAG: excinuclease ABC subunit A [Candidatus Magasanikbacteria bacterium RIFCSPLOWO2_02_FULL_47_16]OGH79828.1 MAG: excinuclease ABC subunit A [Candidatus Magasanikbacteria bacterium RIFCSPHIGHO2_02_FULL_48_18]HAZ28343.1 excinuclease ABC subunit UvrA [Candidatus Magasanikbacteria bacterium]
MKEGCIAITNARVNNLKNVSLEIPKNKLIVITGLSGSGKSSLAFDTIYAEGQRRYAESLNAYARQFMDMQDKPDVDDIAGLSPTIAIDQKIHTHNPRSTVGTVTEIHDYLRLLFARIGVQYCPKCRTPVAKQSVGQMTEIGRDMARQHPLLVLSPLIAEARVKQKELLHRLEQTGYSAFRMNGTIMNITELSKWKFDSQKTYDIDAITGNVTDPKKQNIALMVEKAADLSNGSVIFFDTETGEEYPYSTFPICPSCQRTFEPIEPRSFSFNSPYGACIRCTGIGKTLEIDPELVIPNPRLTLAEGAIQPWTRIVGNQQYYQKLLAAVAETHNFSVHTPLHALPQPHIDILMYGTDGKEYVIDSKRVRFEGIAPNLTQRHAETKSEYVRKEIEQYMREKICPMCKGERLKQESLHVKIGEYSIADFLELNVGDLQQTFQTFVPERENKKPKKEPARRAKNNLAIIVPIAKEINTRLNNLVKVGLEYLSLDRAVTTLSGGEYQRVRLSTQLSTGLTGVIYILDEPSIGLHAKDQQKLIETLKELRDNDNTVIIVEHDKAMMEAADYIVDVGPGAGMYGGEIVATGTPAEIKKNKKSLTGQYLAQKEMIPIPKKIRTKDGDTLGIVGAKAFNLKNIDVAIPLGRLICVTGVSGSGKTTLIHDILGKALSKHFYQAKAEPGAHKKIQGLSHINKVIAIDQTPIGRTPRSNPATYTGLFTGIRDLFTAQPEAKMRGYDAGKFSFNVKGGGRCEACSGEGYARIPMQFLNDVFVECNECEGKRYTKETLEIHYRAKNIADILEMTIEEAYEFFRDVPAIAEKLSVLRNVGLGYLHLGQPATTLSGGEAQRVKLATELSRKATGKTLYILDEPTSGLHFEDIKKLLLVLDQLVEKGNTVLIIEHNLDVIKCADWIIDLGPGGGKHGGEIIASGTPTDIAACQESFTGKYLKRVLQEQKKTRS